MISDNIKLIGEGKDTNKIEWYNVRLGKITDKYKVSLKTFVVKNKQLIINSEKVIIDPINYDIETVLVDKKLPKSTGDFFRGLIGKN